MYSKFIKLVVLLSLLVCCGFAGRALYSRFSLSRVQGKDLRHSPSSRSRCATRMFSPRYKISSSPDPSNAYVASRLLTPPGNVVYLPRAAPRFAVHQSM